MAEVTEGRPAAASGDHLPAGIAATAPDDTVTRADTVRPDGTVRPEDDAAARRAERWGVLPPRVTPAEMVEELATGQVADPEAGRDAERDWMLRYAG